MQYYACIEVRHRSCRRYVVTKYLIKIIINIIFHFTPCVSPQPIKCMSPRAIGLRLLVSRTDTGCYMEKVMYYSLCICCFYNPTPPKKYFFFIKTTCNTLVPTHESAIKIKKLQEKNFNNNILTQTTKDRCILKRIIFHHFLTVSHVHL